MREILFKGKRKDNFEWVYGSYLIRTNPCIEFFYFAEDGVPETDIAEVIPETVGQYTSWNDKCGKKIFEGDIVKIPVWRTYGNESGTFEKGVVEFCDCAFSVLYENDTRRNFIGYLDNLEVIGNIFDNPDLFERCST